MRRRLWGPRPNPSPPYLHGTRPLPEGSPCSEEEAVGSPEAPAPTLPVDSEVGCGAEPSISERSSIS